MFELQVFERAHLNKNGSVCKKMPILIEISNQATDETV